MRIQLLDLETTAGFLERQKIAFGPGLNCIIGARGTCKSTIVETLRFLFRQNVLRDSHLIEIVKEGPDSGPDASRELPGRGVISATLAPGSARLHMIMSDESGDTKFRIERDTVPATAIRVFKDDVPLSDPEPVLRFAEIYSQGELYQIAKQPASRLALVDRPNFGQIRDLRIMLREKSSQLRVTGEAIRTLQSEVQRRQSTITQLPAYRQALAQLQRDNPGESDELQKEHEMYLQRERVREWAQAAANNADEFLQIIGRATTSAVDVQTVVAELNKLELPAAKIVAESLVRTRQLAATVQDEIDDIRSVGFGIGELIEALNQKSRRYFELLHMHQARQEQLKQEASYREQIAHLERIEAEVRSISVNIESHVANREALRSQVQSIRDQLLSLRSNQIERINNRFSQRIFLNLQPPSDVDFYRQELRRLLQGSNLRDQDAIADQLAKTLAPDQIIRVAEQQESEHVAKLLQRDIAQINRLLSYLIEHPDLYSLEEIVLDDALEITLYDQGKSKSMAELSKGQMATALLPLILREDSYPLIIDQPEDDLDNSFVFETLVELVRELKLTRQIIFVTHNANIPVLGEAENVIVMTMQGPNRIDLPTYGSVDEKKEDILRLLEGGELAFRKRAAMYAPAFREE